MKRLKLAIMCVLFVTAAKAQDETIHVNGNIIKFGRDIEERVYYFTDSRIREEFKRKFSVEQRIPKELNGKRIIFDSTGTAIANGLKLFETFLRILEPELKALPEGDYSIELSQVVLDASGSVAYFDTVYNCMLRPRRYNERIPGDIYRSVMRKMSDELRTVKLLPAKHRGKPAPSLILNPFVNKILYVNEGEVTVF